MTDHLLQQIDFYILATNDYLSFACRLLEKAYLKGQRVYVVMENHTKAEELNNLLWTFKDISFVPHHLENSSELHVSPIGISLSDSMLPATAQYDVLLLLTPNLPEYYSRFPRLLYVVPDELEWKEQGRKHYKTLMQAGYEIQMHRV